VPDQDHKHPFRVGLTGGIASGKSTVADLFARLAVPVIDTDVIARKIVQPGEPALEEIRERFGDSIVSATGLDRVAMRKLVFSDAKARHDLERILHPRIAAETRRQADIAPGPYQVIVIPLLPGSTLMQFIDRVLVVDCSEETQIERLQARDAETADQARRMLCAQASRAARLEIADDVIDNSKSFAAAQQRVVTLDQQYRKLACH